MAETSVGSSDDQHHSQRAPDPSSLTTASIQREIAHLSDRIDLKIAGVVAAFAARVDAVEAAAEKFEASLVRVPTEVQRAIASEHALSDQRFQALGVQLTDMERLRDEQFRSIQVILAERDQRAVAQAACADKAVDAALTAAEKAVNKQAEAFTAAAGRNEASFTKQLDQLGVIVHATDEATDAKISDIKDRLVRLEGTLVTQAGFRGEQHQASAFAVSVVAVVLAFLAMTASILMHFMAPGK